MFLCGCTHVENVCVPECHDIKLNWHGYHADVKQTFQGFAPVMNMGVCRALLGDFKKCFRAILHMPACFLISWCPTESSSGLAQPLTCQVHPITNLSSMVLQGWWEMELGPQSQA